MWQKFKNLLLGQTLRTDELMGEKFNVFWGLPILSSDAISSVAYAGEEMLWVLVPVLGVMSYKYMFLAALAIVLLLFILVFSYRQTIDNYPCGGGSYIVAQDNLGEIPGLVAAASLSIDYVLTVAVSASAGTLAIISAFPQLLEHRVSITIAVITLLTIGNLRGVKDSSRVFGIPTYLFILSIAIMIIVGVFKVTVLGYVPTAAIPVPNAVGDITLLLFIKAFASGCTALTGVEAVSNGIPNFKEPSQKNAKRVLILLGLIVLFIFGGLSFLATFFHAVPSDSKSVVSQIAEQVFGMSFMFYAVQVTTALILVMAANTAYADLPLLLSILAKDGFVPKQFAKRGKRLSFSNGIILLWIASVALTIMFKGDTHLLMPLYAVGVFISFTLSQSGMLKKWLKEKNSGWRHKAVINGFGAMLSLLTAVVIGTTKFQHGAWIVCILIPIFVICMLRIKKHYNRVAKQLKLDIQEKPKDIEVTEHHVIVPIDTLNKSFLKSLNYAKSISHNVVAFHVSVDDEATEKLKRKWKEYNPGISLVVKKSPYRSIVTPMVKFIESEEHDSRGDDIITVVIPQFVINRWWNHILHNQTSFFVRGMLLKRRNIAIVTLPYIIEE